MVTTKQQLEEQQRLKDKQLNLQREQTQQSYDLDKKGIGLSEEQLNQSYLLSQSQLKQMSDEKTSQSSKLAQQAYISKKQNERVMPDVLASQGLANTGYVNVRKNQLEQGYQGQYGAIQDDLNAYMSNAKRQKESQDLNFNQNISQINLQKQQYELQYQQRLKAWELDNEAASLDFRQALNRLSASGSGSGGTISQSNVQLINTALSKAIKEGSLDTNSAALAAKGYYDKGYLEKQDYYNTVRGAKQLADAVAQLNARKPVVKNTKGR